MDALGVLEQVFQLLWPGRLGAQPPLCPVSREPLPPPPPARPRPLPAYTRSVPFNPTEPAGMRVGLVGAGDGKGSPRGWGSPAPLRTPFSSRLPGEEPCWGDSHEYRVCQLPVNPRVRPESLLLCYTHPKNPLGVADLIYPSLSSPRTARQVRNPSETCNVRSTTAFPSWAPRRPTSGCPSTEVSNLTSWD